MTLRNLLIFGSSGVRPTQSAISIRPPESGSISVTLENVVLLAHPDYQSDIGRTSFPIGDRSGAPRNAIRVVGSRFGGADGTVHLTLKNVRIIGFEGDGIIFFPGEYSESTFTATNLDIERSGRYGLQLGGLTTRATLMQDDEIEGQTRFTLNKSSGVQAFDIGSIHWDGGMTSRNGAFGLAIGAGTQSAILRNLSIEQNFSEGLHIHSERINRLDLRMSDSLIRGNGAPLAETMPGLPEVRFTDSVTGDTRATFIDCEMPAGEESIRNDGEAVVRFTLTGDSIPE